MKNHLLIVLCFCMVLPTLAQEQTRALSSDRPGATNSALTVGKGKLQIQSGFLYQKSKSMGSILDPSQLVPADFVFIYHNRLLTNQIRWGILKKTEVGINVDYNFLELDDRINGMLIERDNGNFSDFMKLGLSIRQEFVQESKYLPLVSYLVNFNTDGSLFEDIDKANTSLLMLILLQKSFGKSFSLSANIGFDFVFNDAIFNNTLNLGYTLSQKLSLFIETYGLTSDWGFDRYFNGGFAYIIKNNILFDFYAGWGYTQFNYTSVFDYEESRFLQVTYQESQFLIGTGLSYRFD